MVRNPNDLGGVRTVVVDRPLDEAELVERARRGDLEAWETLVRTYQGIAFRTAYLLAGNAADAEEAARDRRHGAARARPFPAWRAAQAVAAADRRQRGSQPPPVGGPPRAARPARDRRDPPGGRGP